MTKEGTKAGKASIPLNANHDKGHVTDQQIHGWGTQSQ